MGERGNILVTGGAGFIGSHLVERLLREGHSVTVIDDCSTGSLENLAAVRGDSKLELIQSTVSECADIPVLCARAKYVIHLAAAVGVELVVKSPVRTIETNLNETEVVLTSASSSGTPVLLTSTSEVYGKSSKESFSEEDDLLIGPPHLGRWSYACSKLMDEFLALAYHRERQLPVVIARLFNTVGPRQTGRYGMVLPRFVQAALRGEPLVVYGDGKQTRCFCHVNDTVEAIVRLQNSAAANGQVVNIGSTEEISVFDLARRVVALLNSKSEVRKMSYAEAYQPGFEDMPRRRPSVEKLLRLTNFSPATRLDETILSVAQALRGAAT